MFFCPFHSCLYYQYKPCHDIRLYITLTRCLSVWLLFSFVCLFQDKTLPPNSSYLASLSLLGCCCSSLSSLWPPTAYGGNRKKGKEAEKEIDLEGKEADKITGSRKKRGRNRKPITNVTPILQFSTTLFFCLYKSYLINGGFAH